MRSDRLGQSVSGNDAVSRVAAFGSSLGREPVVSGVRSAPSPRRGRMNASIAPCGGSIRPRSAKPTGLRPRLLTGAPCGGLGRIGWSLILSMTVALTAPSALAHKTNLFAEVAAGRIIGQVYFGGGGKAVGMTVDLFGPDGAPRAQVTTDAAGDFAFTPPAPGEYRIVADAGDGHRAETAVTVGGSAPVAGPNDGLSLQIAALSRRIDQYEHRVRLGEVIGGIGAIVGVFGVYCYLAGRRRGRTAKTE